MRKLAFFLAFLFFCPSPILAKNIEDISVSDAAKMIQENRPDLIILDTRTPGEFREGHIEGAANLDFFGGAFEVEAAKLPRDATILLYCRSGRRSQAAAEAMRNMDFKNVLNMKGGLNAWEKSGRKTEKAD